jgi:perosamine synthetase
VKPYTSVSRTDLMSAVLAMADEPLSGYLAGKMRGGKNVCALEDAWSQTFHVKHSIAVNSATSGLLAAAFAVGLKPGYQFIVSPMTMSATAAAPMFTGATPVFRDVEDETFGIDPAPISGEIRAIFSTNLFGHAGRLGHALMRSSTAPLFHVEDNAQSPFARFENGKYAGTIGHIGVFSLNVHKHFQCGEGGMVVTDSDSLAEKIRAFINHGENVGDAIGLNLRMPEVCAAIGLAQLRAGKILVARRIDQAEAILRAIGPLPGIRQPVTRQGCTHVYYTIPFVINYRVGTADSDINPFTFQREARKKFCDSLREDDIPIVEGYVEPLYRLPPFKPYARHCPVAEELQDQRLFYFENCAWDLTPAEIKKVGEAFRRAADRMASA